MDLEKNCLKDFGILITGAAGFLGAYLVKRLLETGAFIVGLDILPLTPRIKAITSKNSNFQYISAEFPHLIYRGPPVFD